MLKEVCLVYICGAFTRTLRDSATSEVMKIVQTHIGKTWGILVSFSCFHPKRHWSNSLYADGLACWWMRSRLPCLYTGIYLYILRHRIHFLTPFVYLYTRSWKNPSVQGNAGSRPLYKPVSGPQALCALLLYVTEARPHASFHAYNVSFCYVIMYSWLLIRM